MFPHLPSDQPAVDSRLFALPSSPFSAQLALVWLLSTRTNHEFDRGKEKTSPWGDRRSSAKAYGVWVCWCWL
jgi:hypothetical protein